MVANQGSQWVRFHNTFAFGAGNCNSQIYSVDGEWIVAKKDWKEAQRRAKSRERRDKSKERKEQKKPSQEPSTDPVEDPAESGYTPDMDDQRCILYLHGGKPSFIQFIHRLRFMTRT